MDERFDAEIPSSKDTDMLRTVVNDDSREMEIEGREKVHTDSGVSDITDNHAGKVTVELVQSTNQQDEQNTMIIEEPALQEEQLVNKDHQNTMIIEEPTLHQEQLVNKDQQNTMIIEEPSLQEEQLVNKDQHNTMLTEVETTKQDNEKTYDQENHNNLIDSQIQEQKTVADEDINTDNCQ